MKKLILFIILLSAQLIPAQIKVYNEAEYQSEPYFPGGWNKYFGFVEKNFKWINERNSKNIKLDLTVQADGKLTNAKIVDPVGSPNEKEALRVVSLMPKWVPATKAGKKVSCKISLGMFNPYEKSRSNDIGMLSLGDDLPQTEGEDNSIYNSAGLELKPEFPGGLDKLYQFFNANFKKPEEANLNGKVFTCFVVEKDGSLSDIKILRDIGYDTGKEAIRVLKVSPKWNPGQQNGKTVRVLYSMPFTITTETKAEPVKK